jgi:hypothetical protein
MKQSKEIGPKYIIELDSFIASKPEFESEQSIHNFYLSYDGYE